MRAGLNYEGRTVKRHLVEWRLQALMSREVWVHGRERKGEEKEEFSKLEKLKKTDFALGGELGSEEEDKEKIENRRNSSPTSTVTLIQMLYWFLMITDNS